MFGPIQNVIFDFDGTLVDTMPSIIEGLGGAVSRVLGRAVTTAELMPTFGPAPRAVISTWVPEDRVDEAYAEWVAFEAGREASHFAPFEGVEMMLSSLKSAGIGIGIFTGRDRLGTLRIAKHWGWLGPYFSENEMICGDDGFRTKPHPDGLNELIKRKLWSAASCLMVGDHAHDVNAGRSAGTKTAAVLWDQPQGVGTERARFRDSWNKWNAVDCDLRLAKPQSLMEWLGR